MNALDHSVGKKKGDVFLLWRDSERFISHLVTSTHLTKDVYPVHHKVYKLLEPVSVCHLDRLRLWRQRARVVSVSEVPGSSPTLITTWICVSVAPSSDPRPRSIYQYSNMAPRLLGQTSNFGVVFFVSKSLLGTKQLNDNRNMKNLQFKPECLGSMLEYWNIERGLLANWFASGQLQFLTLLCTIWIVCSTPLALVL